MMISVKCYGCGLHYEAADPAGRSAVSRGHCTHTGDTGFPREMLLDALNRLQDERDWWIGVAVAVASGQRPDLACRDAAGAMESLCADDVCPECGVRWDTPSPACQQFMYCAHPAWPVTKAGSGR